MSIKQVFTMTEVITIVSQVVADIELRAKKHAPETAAVIVGATPPEHRVAGIAFALDLGTVPEGKPDPEWKAEHNFEPPKPVKLGMCAMPPPELDFVPMDPVMTGPSQEVIIHGPPKKLPWSKVIDAMMTLPPSMAAQKALWDIDYLSTPAVSAAVDAAYQQMKKTLASVATPGFKVVLEPVAFDPMKCTAGVDLGPLLSGMKFDLQHLKKWKADDTNSVSAGKVVDTSVVEFLGGGGIPAGLAWHQPTIETQPPKFITIPGTLTPKTARLK